MPLRGTLLAVLCRMHVQGQALVLEVGAQRTVGEEWRGALRNHGFAIDQARDGFEALQLLAKCRYPVAFLHRADSSVGETAEFGPTLRRLKPSLGIVLLGPRWTARERRGLIEEFADECLEHRAPAEELIAVLTALSRRAHGAAQVSCRLASATLRLDFMGSVVVIDEKEIPLQPLQMRILACLIEHSGTVVSHEQLQRLVFRASHLCRNSVSRQICVLRRQLGPFGSLIATAEGGYGLGLA